MARVEDARSLGLNMFRVAEATLRGAAKAERNRLWRTHNAEALARYAEEVERDGLSLARYRSF